MSHRVVFHSGCFVPEREALISIYDAALSGGAMVFEVCRTFNGHPFKLREHIERLFHSLATLGIDPGYSQVKLESLASETLHRNVPTQRSDVDWNIIFNVSSGPGTAFREAFSEEELRATVIISCFPLTRRMASVAEAYQRGVDAVVPCQRALPPEMIDPAVKIRGRLHYLLAANQANEIHPGAVAVLVNQQGNLTESTNANVFLVDVEGILRTPRIKDVLPGVTRGTIIDLAGELGIHVKETDLTQEDALRASEFLLTSTSIGVLHARSFNGSPVGDGKLGPLGKQLRTALNKLVGVDLAAQASSYAQHLAEGKTHGAT